MVIRSCGYSGFAALPVMLRNDSAATGIKFLILDMPVTIQCYTSAVQFSHLEIGVLTQCSSG